MKKMKVELLNYTPLWIASDAIRTAWQSGDKSDTEEEDICPNCESTNINYEGRPSGESDTAGWICNRCRYCFIDPDIKTITGPKDKALIERVGNKFKHASTLEHLYYNFHISDISRALLQELARHRISSLTVKSTRYTLKELKNEEPFVNDLNI